MLHFEGNVPNAAGLDLPAVQANILLVAEVGALHGAAGAEGGTDLPGQVPALQDPVDLGENLEPFLQLLVVLQIL